MYPKKSLIISMALATIAFIAGLSIGLVYKTKPQQVSKCEQIRADLSKIPLLDEKKQENQGNSDEKATTQKEGVMFVASKNGTKYYIDGKGYSSRIKEENKVFFKTKEEAEKAGYEPGSGVE